MCVTVVQPYQINPQNKADFLKEVTKMAKRFFNSLIKCAGISAAIFIMITILALVFAFFTLGHFAPDYISSANFTVGGLIALIGIIAAARPFSTSQLGGHHMGFGPSASMMDYEAQETLKNASIKDSKWVGASKLIYIGLGIIAITVPAQYLLSR